MESSTVLFRSPDGRQLTRRDLEGATGRIHYELLGDRDVSPAARSHHWLGRIAARSGHRDSALHYFGLAVDASPEWPLPRYERAEVRLEHGDASGALEDYQQAAELSPRGFFRTLTALHSLRREERGELPPGTYRAYVELDRCSTAALRSARVASLLERAPGFAPAWVQRALLERRHEVRLEHIAHGLASEPDAETYGTLRVNQALCLDGRGEREQAIEILGRLALDPAATLGSVELAKMALRAMIQAF